MTRIKVCGVTRPQDAAAAVAAGVDFLGLNFWPGSKRYLAPAMAGRVAAEARAAGAAQIVGVFVDPDPAEVAAIAGTLGLDAIQLHGDEPPDVGAAIAVATGRPVWKALAADVARDRIAGYQVDVVLIDTPTPGRGGSGATFDWAIARELRRLHPERRLVLAGGLGPDNVAAAIAEVSPWAIDIASGVESAPGIKDPVRVAALVAAVRTSVRA
jgi:phosphoribosylanthranilate isomerase